MKKVYLFKIKQHQHESYVGVVSARDLVRLATREELGDEQKIQRVLDEGRLDKISEFVMNNGVLSGSITIGTRDTERLNVDPVENSGIPNLYYTWFPETEEEFKKYENSFDIMDGQHRLFSFLKDKMKIDDSVDYDITFNMYIVPSLRDKRLIFKNTNQEQKQVPSNLLLWFRKKLDMFYSEEEKFYNTVVEMLATEACSPLKDLIIIGDKKITGGFKAIQLINILQKKINLMDLLGKSTEPEMYVKAISNYLQGWEKATRKKISIRETEYAPYSKISGLRFMLILMPAIFNKARTEHASFTKDYVADTLTSLFALESMEPISIFSTEFIKAQETNPYAAETPTTELANYWRDKLKELENKTFDPLNF